MFKHVCTDKCGKWCPPRWLTRDLGILVLRIALGGMFLHHGLAKFADMQGTVAFFASLGFGTFWAWLAAFVETLGGIAILLGVLQGPAAILIAIEMLVVIFGVKWSKGFNSYEYELVFALALIAIALIGRGKYALMGCCCSCDACKQGTCPGSASCACSDSESESQKQG